MTTMAGHESQIENIEAFRVVIYHDRGRNVRGDLSHVGNYPYTRRAPDYWTEFIRRRLNYFGGYEIEVRFGDGTAAAGNTTLRRVRDSY